MNTELKLKSLMSDLEFAKNTVKVMATEVVEYEKLADQNEEVLALKNRMFDEALDRVAMLRRELKELELYL